MLDRIQDRAPARVNRPLSDLRGRSAAEELAAEWRDVQLWRIGEHRPTPFAAWIETPDWEAGFARAVAFAERLRERAAKQRELRQKAKAWKKERKQR